MPVTSATRDQILNRVHTQLVVDAKAAAGKGGVLSKAEQEALQKTSSGSVLADAARDVRNDHKGALRVDPWVKAAAAKVIGALDVVDKPGRGHGKISLSEAREAVATKGDAGFRIGRAFELVTGASLETKAKASAELSAAVAGLVKEKGFAALSGMKGDEPSAWVQKKIEDQVEKWGADGVNTQGKIKIGDVTVHVATGSTSMRHSMRELVGFFDDEGRLLGRAQIDRDDKSFALTMKSVSNGGKAGDVVGSIGDGAAADKAFTDALTTELQPKWDDGRELGVEMKRADLPAPVLAAYEFAERNTPDGVGLEKIEFQGKTLYAIHDYSCVTSVAVLDAAGKKLVDFVE